MWRVKSKLNKKFTHTQKKKNEITYKIISKLYQKSLFFFIGEKESGREGGGEKRWDGGHVSQLFFATSPVKQQKI